MQPAGADALLFAAAGCRLAKAQVASSLLTSAQLAHAKELSCAWSCRHSRCCWLLAAGCWLPANCSFTALVPLMVARCCAGGRRAHHRHHATDACPTERGKSDLCVLRAC